MEYVKAALQTILLVCSAIFLFELAYNNGEMAREVIAWGFMGLLAFLMIAWIFQGFLIRNLRKSGKYKEPDVNNHYG
jgi:hypothetical protein